MDIVGWSHPPRPIEIIPSFDPGANGAAKVRAVLYDFWHDDDIRAALDAGNGRGPWILSGAQYLQNLNPQQLIQIYFSPEGWLNAHPEARSAVSSAADIRAQDWFKKLQVAVPKAIAKRMALGPLPSNDYSGDPVVIYYYDNDRIKRIEYPRSSISTATGMALDPTNVKWWSGNGIGTYEQDPNTGEWGDEGFDWNKDIAGNISQILQVIVSAIGAVLVATGVGAAAGAAFLAFGAALAAWGGIIDAALIGGNVGQAALGFLNACTKLLGVEIKTMPAGLTKLALQGTVIMLGRFAPLLTTLQAQGKGFAETAENLSAQAKTMGTVTDERVSQLVGLGGGPTLLHGYIVSQFADELTVQGASSLIPDDATRSLFQLGAYLGFVKKQQAIVGSTDTSAHGTLHQSGKQVTAEESLNRFIIALGLKYGLGQPSWAVFLSAHPDYQSNTLTLSQAASKNIVPIAAVLNAAPVKAPTTSGGIPLTRQSL